jgi:hypothetical protein
MLKNKEEKPIRLQKENPKEIRNDIKRKNRGSNKITITMLLNHLKGYFRPRTKTFQNKEKLCKYCLIKIKIKI